MKIEKTTNQIETWLLVGSLKSEQSSIILAQQSGHPII